MAKLASTTRRTRIRSVSHLFEQRLIQIEETDEIIFTQTRFRENLPHGLIQSGQRLLNVVSPTLTSGNIASDRLLVTFDG
jgi:hypothetical protein